MRSHGTRGREMLKKTNQPGREMVDLSRGQNHYLGAKLRHTRMTKGLRLHDLAEKAECSESMLSKIENGRAVPSLKILYRIAEALGLTVGQLFAQPAEPNGLVSRDGERPLCMRTRCATAPD